MLELHQFRHSAFCEKVRLVLAAKRLPYTVVEVVPGLGQVQLLRISGQRQVPVLVDGAEVVADSSAIALHLERLQPEPALLPADPALRAQVLLLEDWADTALAAGARWRWCRPQPPILCCALACCRKPPQRRCAPSPPPCRAICCGAWAR